MQMLAFVLARLSEPSSYAGLGAILALAGFHFSNSDLGQLAQFLAAGCGLAALLLKERGLIQMIALAVMLGAALGACTGPQRADPGDGASRRASRSLTATQQAMCASAVGGESRRARRGGGRRCRQQRPTHPRLRPPRAPAAPGPTRR